MLALRRYRLLFTTVVTAVGIFAALLAFESAFGEYEEAKDSIERPVSAHQIVENAKSIIGQSGQQTEGTKQWRLNWWDIIINDTIYGPNFWTGRGFGSISPKPTVSPGERTGAIIVRRRAVRIACT